MAEMLDRKDIDALLAAVERGQVAAGPRMAADDEREVTVYDFRRPERVSKDHLRAIEGLHEGFARTLSASLSTFLRAVVDVRVASVEQCTYGEFILSLPNPTCFYLLGVKPIEGSMIVEVSPSIVFPMLDRLLGGGREQPLVPHRPLTEIEQRLFNRLVDRTLRALTDSWAPVEVMELSVLQTESNPSMVQALPAGEVVVLAALEVSLGEAKGMLNVCIPFTVVEPVMNRILRAGRLSFVDRGPAAPHARPITKAIAHAAVRLTAFLAQTSITVGDLMNLNIGDIIKTEKPADSTLLVTVEGRPKFRGRLVEHRSRKAILVTGRASPRGRI